MKKMLLIYASLLIFLLTGCGDSENKKQALSGTDTNNRDSVVVTNKTSIIGDTKTVNNTIGPQAIAIIEKYLQGNLKSDLGKGLIDTSSMKFIADEIDLNSDDSKEIFVGLTGSYFCGSGGCTCLLLNSKGGLITRFTVAQYPVIILADRTNGWCNLAIETGIEYHQMKFDGKKYPSNPSMQPGTVVKPANMLKSALDIQQNKHTWYTF